MNTFLPYADFQRSAACLDNKRLGNQRKETLQLLRGNWFNHPASKMWRGYNDALAIYGLYICQEWMNRDFKDTHFEKIAAFLPSVSNWMELEIVYPSWFGQESFHAAHRSNLLRKDYDYYKQFGWKENEFLPYIWPKEK